jgi:hypothetical protein
VIVLPPNGWTVYRAADAGAPQLHGVAAGYAGDWHYAPNDVPPGEVWSAGYPTRQQAIRAAWDESEGLPPPPPRAASLLPADYWRGCDWEADADGPTDYWRGADAEGGAP